MDAILKLMPWLDDNLRDPGNERLAYMHAEGLGVARACGSGEIFYHLVCINDPVSIRGFNPRIGFRRTSTLAEGMDRCDHTYILPGA